LCLRLRLCLCLYLKLSVLAYMMMRLLVVALGPLARVLLLVREDVLHLLLLLVVCLGWAVLSRRSKNVLVCTLTVQRSREGVVLSRR
jgi:hypothetical protein